MSDTLAYDGGVQLFQNTVNEKVDEILSDYIILENTYMETGEISSISLNTQEINQFKSTLTQELNESLSENVTLWIPIGNFTNIQLLNGLGFKIPVTISYTGTATVDFLDEINSTGINQTKYTVSLDVTAVLHTNSVRYKEEIVLNTSYILAQTVIVGNVPTVNYGSN